MNLTSRVHPVPIFNCCSVNLFFFADETISSLENRLVESEASNGPLDVPTPRSVTFTEHDNPFFLGNEDKGPRHIAALSSLSWVNCGGDIYVLELLTRGFIRIELDGEGILFLLILSQLYLHRDITPFCGLIYPSDLSCRIGIRHKALTISGQTANFNCRNS